MSTSKTQVTFYEKALAQGVTIVGNFAGVMNPVHCVCPNGHDCYPTPNNIARRVNGWCFTCTGSSIEKGKQRFMFHASESSVQVIGSYRGANTPIECICPQGHTIRITPTNSYKQGWCSVCVNRDHDAGRDKFYALCDFYGVILQSEYVLGGYPVSAVCKNGHEYMPQWGNTETFPIEYIESVEDWVNTIIFDEW